MKKFSLLLCSLFLTISGIMAQRTVSGIVNDSGGEALIGANVLVKGTTLGTVTDIDGSFSLQVPDGSNTLVVSYTGFETQEFDVANQSTITIALQEGELLDEVVVTALGIEREAKTLGYGIDQVESEELVKARDANIINCLLYTSPSPRD